MNLRMLLIDTIDQLNKVLHNWIKAESKEDRMEVSATRVPVENEYKSPAKEHDCTKNVPTENDDNVETENEDFQSSAATYYHSIQSENNSQEIYYSTRQNHEKQCPCSECCYAVNSAHFISNKCFVDVESDKPTFSEDSPHKQSFHFGRVQNHPDHPDELQCHSQMNCCFSHNKYRTPPLYNACKERTLPFFKKPVSPVSKQRGCSDDPQLPFHTPVTKQSCMSSLNSECIPAFTCGSHGVAHRPEHHTRNKSKTKIDSDDNADDEESTDEDTTESDIEATPDPTNPFVEPIWTKDKINLGLSQPKMTRHLRWKKMKTEKEKKGRRRGKHILKNETTKQAFGNEIPVTLQMLEDEDKAVDDYQDQIFNRKGIALQSETINIIYSDVIPSFVEEHQEINIYNSEENNNQITISERNERNEVLSVKIINESMKETTFSSAAITERRIVPTENQDEYHPERMNHLCTTSVCNSSLNGHKKMEHTEPVDFTMSLHDSGIESVVSETQEETKTELPHPFVSECATMNEDKSYTRKSNDSGKEIQTGNVPQLSNEDDNKTINDDIDIKNEFQTNNAIESVSIAIDNYDYDKDKSISLTIQQQKDEDTLRIKHEPNPSLEKTNGGDIFNTADFEQVHSVHDSGLESLVSETSEEANNESSNSRVLEHDSMKAVENYTWNINKNVEEHRTGNELKCADVSDNKLTEDEMNLNSEFYMSNAKESGDTSIPVGNCDREKDKMIFMTNHLDNNENHLGKIKKQETSQSNSETDDVLNNSLEVPECITDEGSILFIPNCEDEDQELPQDNAVREIKSTVSKNPQRTKGASKRTQIDTKTKSLPSRDNKKDFSPFKTLKESTVTTTISQKSQNMELQCNITDELTQMERNVHRKVKPPKHQSWRGNETPRKSQGKNNSERAASKSTTLSAKPNPPDKDKPDEIDDDIRNSNHVSTRHQNPKNAYLKHRNPVFVDLTQAGFRRVLYQRYRVAEHRNVKGQGATFGTYRRFDKKKATLSGFIRRESTSPEKFVYQKDIRYSPTLYYSDLRLSSRSSTNASNKPPKEPLVKWNLTVPGQEVLMELYPQFTNSEDYQHCRSIPRLRTSCFTCDADVYGPRAYEINIAHMVSRIPLAPQLLPHAAPSNERYAMSQRPVGIAVIILNENIDGHPCRCGARKDLDYFKSLWWSLGFTVDVHIDKTRNEIKQLIDWYKQQPHTQYDAFVVCISAHGYRGHFLGKQNCAVNIVNDIVQPLHDCPTLRGKPKLCFIQACQNIEIRSDRGYPICQERSYDCDRSESTVNFHEHTSVQRQKSEAVPQSELSDSHGGTSDNGKPICQERAAVNETNIPSIRYGVTEHGVNQQGDGQRRVNFRGERYQPQRIRRFVTDALHSEIDEGNLYTIDLQMFPDFLLSFASIDGVSWRDTQYGSFFPLSLHRNVLYYSPQTDIRNILNLAVRPEVEMMTARFGCQSPQYISTLQKQLCFPLADVAFWGR